MPTHYSLNLTKHTSNPSILSSLAWNSVRDVLTSVGKSGLIDYIESVKVTEKRITIKTNKPIVNQELSHHREAVLERINQSFKSFWVKGGERKIVLL